MSETEIDTENVESQRLRLKTKAELEGPDGEQNGQVYSEMLRQLQIDPLQQESWFISNLKTVRNKEVARKLILKGDAASLRLMSDKCLTALGKITWEKKREWLLPVEDLEEGEEPLFYKLPTERAEGDHDRFYPPMEAMWKEMRNQIYTDKPLPTPTPTLPGTPDDLTHSGHKKKRGYYYFEPKTLDYSHNWIPIPTHADEIIPEGKWSERQTEQAILHIIRTLNNARHSSDARVFEHVFQRFLAQLEDIEYADELKIPERQFQPVQNGQETQNHIQTTSANGDEDTEMDLHESSFDKSQADHYTHPESRPDANRLLTSGVRETEAGPKTVHSDAMYIPPSGSLLSYLPATYPATIATYITPFSSSSAVVPYSWVDAPCLPSSYGNFVSGVRLRAGVPELPRVPNLVIVLAYGWNDFCRVVRNERDWIEGFQKDIRRAAEQDRVDIWRLRVCCFV